MDNSFTQFRVEGNGVTTSGLTLNIPLVMISLTLKMQQLIGFSSWMSHMLAMLLVHGLIVLQLLIIHTITTGANACTNLLSKKTKTLTFRTITP